MGALRLSTVSLSVLFLLACSGAKAPQPAPPPPAKTVFDPLTQQLDRAKDVQHTVDAGADAARQAVDNEERGDSAR